MEGSLNPKDRKSLISKSEMDFASTDMAWLPKSRGRRAANRNAGGAEKNLLD